MQGALASSFAKPVSPRSPENFFAQRAEIGDKAHRAEGQHRRGQLAGPVWLAEAQGLRGSARQGKGAQCGCPKGTAVAGANQAMGQWASRQFAYRSRDFLNDA